MNVVVFLNDTATTWSYTYRHTRSLHDALPISHRHTRRAIGAARAIGDQLAAPEPDAAERVVQFVRTIAAEFGEHLALGLARQIRARRRAGDEKARKTKRCGHAKKTSGLAMRSPPTRVRRAACTNYAARRQWCKVHLPFLNVPI